MKKFLLIVCTGIILVACKDPTIKVESIKVETTEKSAAKVVDSQKPFASQQIEDSKFFESQQIFETPDSFYVSLERVDDSVYFAVGYSSNKASDLTVFVESEIGVPLFNLTPCKTAEKLYKTEDKVCYGKVKVSESVWKKTLKGYVGYVGKNQGRVELVSHGEYGKKVSNAVSFVEKNYTLPKEMFDGNGNLSKLGEDVILKSQIAKDILELRGIK